MTRPIRTPHTAKPGSASWLLVATLASCAAGPALRGVTPPMATQSAGVGGGEALSNTADGSAEQAAGAKDATKLSDGAAAGNTNHVVQQAIDAALTFDLPEPKLARKRRRTLWATYYYVPQVDHLAAGFGLRSMAGKTLGPRLSRRNWCNAAMQGTVMIRLPGGKATTYNYAGTRKNVEVDCGSIFPKHRAVGRSRFVLARGPWGDGSSGRLLPMRTIAADPRVIPDGSLVYIPSARGTAITLPDGQTATHDGYFYAGDHGGAIKRNHIDVFVGIGRNNPFAFVKSNKKKTFKAYVLPANSAAASRLHEGHMAR